MNRLAVRPLLAAWHLCALTASTPLSAQVTRTFAADSLWRRLWVVGIDSTADTFIEPRHVVAGRDLVTVLDVGTRELRGFDPKTGAARFVITSRGTGPGEFKRPALIATTPSGVVVLDHATSRLTAFTSSGKLAWDAQVQNVFAISGLCIPDGRRVLLKLQRRDSSIVEIDTSGRRLRTLHVAWPIRLRDEAGFVHESRVAGPSIDGTCLIAPIFGKHWASVSTGAANTPSVHAYREPGADPIMKQSERVLERSFSKIVVEQLETTDASPIASAIMVRRDTAIVYAAVTRTFSQRTLDYYHLPSGRYLYSRKLPFIVNALTIGDDGIFYGTLVGEKEQALIAMRPERLPTVAPAKGAATPAPARRAGTPGRPPAPARVPPPALR